MFTDSLDPAIVGPASSFTLDHHRDNLGDAVEQLASLRFAIVLSARWESAGVLGSDDRAELRAELGDLRARYNDKIDGIAMKYGVQAAMVSQEGVEREVKIPKNMAPPRKAESIGMHDI